MLKHPIWNIHMYVRILALFLLATSLSVEAAEAEDTSDVKALYDQHCTSCHETEVYTRSDRKVTSHDGLQRQVRRCELALGLKWFDEEIADMTAYLNTHYYRFEP